MSSDVEIKITAKDEASGKIADIRKEFDGLQSGVDSLGASNENTSDSIFGMTSAMKAWGLSVTAATSAITLFIQAFNAGEIAAQNQRLIDSGAELARQYGGSMDEILSRVKAASLGTVSELDIISSANKAMMLGLGANAEQLANLMEIAAFRGRAMGVSTTQAFDDIVRGIGRASPMILDNLGIIIDSESTYENYADAIGVAKEELTKQEKVQALLNKVIDEGNSMLEKAGGLTEDNAAQYERWNAELANTKNYLIDNTLEMSRFASMGSDALVAFRNLADNGIGYGGEKLNAFSLLFEFAEMRVRSHNAALAETESQLGRNALITDYYKNKQAELSETTQSSTLNYKDLIGSIVSYQEAIDKNTEKIQSLKEKESDLNDQRKAAIKKIEDLTKVYGENSKEVSKAKDALGEIDEKLKNNSDAIEKSEEDFRRWAATTVYSFLQVRLGADGVIDVFEGEFLIKAGTSLGLFSDKTAEVMLSVNKSLDSLDPSNAEEALAVVQDSFNSLSSQNAISQVQSLQSYLNDLTNNPYTINLIANVSGEGYVGTTCFSGNTLIKTPHGDKQIMNLVIGDAVYSYDIDEGRIIETVVTEKIKHEPQEIKTYLLINNFLRVTGEHLLWSGDKWIPAGKLQPGDFLFDGKTNVLIESVEQLPKTEPVYNLHVDHACHNYFANGILAHNAKEGEGYAKGGIATGNSNGHWELLHGTEGVFTRDQMAMLAPVGSGAGGVTINLTYAPAVSLASEAELEQHLLPVILKGARQALRQR